MQRLYRVIELIRTGLRGILKLKPPAYTAGGLRVCNRLSKKLSLAT